MSPTESELLEAIDRRAHAAADQLASVVATVPVPEPDAVAPDRRRRQAPLAVAAALILVALVGAAVLRADGGGDGAVAGQPSLTHLVLPDPAGAGYELVAAFDGTEQAPDGIGLIDLPVVVQGPVDRDDPWSAGVLSFSVPAEEAALDGGPQGTDDPVFDADGLATTVGWIDGEDVRYLVSSRLTRDELFALARAAIAEGTPQGAALPGQRILFAGSNTDVFPTLASSIGAPQGLHGVAYKQLDADDGLVIATRSGDEIRRRAASVVAVATEEVTIRGRDAVVARFGADRSMVEVTWLEADGTFVRAGTSLTPGTGALVALLDQLVPIDDDGFAELLRSHPVGPAVEESLSGPEVVEDGSTAGLDGAPLASVEVQIGDRRYEASLRSAGDGGPVTLESGVEGPDGGSGVAIEVTSTDVDAAVANAQDDGTVAIAVLIGPHRGPIEVLDATSGQPVEHEGGSEATIEGSDHTVVLLVATGAQAGQELVIVGTAPDGGEIRVRV